MKSLNDKSLDKEIIRLLRLEEVDSTDTAGDTEENDEVEEASTTGGVAGYNTPNAFSKSKDEDDLDDDHIEVLGYKKAPKKKHKYFVSENDSLYKQIMHQMHTSPVNEVSYKMYKQDETMTSKKKVNNSIKEISRKLFEIERIINQNVRLKNETGVDNGQYWKSTKLGLSKISERLLRIAKQVRDISA